MMMMLVVPLALAQNVFVYVLCSHTSVHYGVSFKSGGSVVKAKQSFSFS